MPTASSPSTTSPATRRCRPRQPRQDAGQTCPQRLYGKSAPQRVRDLIGEEAEELLRHRYVK